MLFWMIFVQSASLPVLAAGIFRNMCCQLSHLTGAMREAEGHNAAHGFGKKIFFVGKNKKDILEHAGYSSCGERWRYSDS